MLLTYIVILHIYLLFRFCCATRVPIDDFVVKYAVAPLWLGCMMVQTIAQFTSISL